MRHFIKVLRVEKINQLNLVKVSMHSTFMPHLVFHSVPSFSLFDLFVRYLDISDGIICIVCYPYSRHRTSTTRGNVLYTLLHTEVYCSRKDQAKVTRPLNNYPEPDIL